MNLENGMQTCEGVWEFLLWLEEEEGGGGTACPCHNYLPSMCNAGPYAVGGGSRYTIIYTHEFVKKNPRLLELDTGLY